MVLKNVGLGSVKRFGTRYGRTVKHKLAKIERIQKSKHTCPYCSRPAVSRVSYGIWNCKKCGNTFTSRAYEVSSVSSASKQDISSVEKPIFKSKKASVEEEA